MNKTILGLVILSQIACSKSEDTASTSTTTTGTVDITTVVQSKFFNGVTVASSGTSIVLKSNGLPDHKTPYWGVGNALYEDFPTNYHANVNTSMTSHTYAMTIVAKPVVSTSHEETTLGAIGMALNGVPIYNDREGGNVALDALTITTFDYSGAHPGPGKDYHYHTTGRYTTTDDANLVGFLRDGFPIYGRKDKDGTYPTLDTYGGHTGITADFPEGIYHYHASNVNYLNTGYYVLKAGSYYGTKGTFTE
ncbi:YHYH protein [uncultured Flavobacterium sp.]|uniref:YHYH protein n=1 Tax=uncultured Flavobacterium sp. TaxID=165435 RepID=UPI0030EC4C77|tara:strand:+ start:519 stop:1268 length:750 start_codon:yes stop_codon:yes gene_type:complete